MFNRILALIWGVAAVVIAYVAVAAAISPKADASGWIFALALGLAAAYAVWRTWSEWTNTGPAGQPHPRPAPTAPQSPEPAEDFPGAWRGPPIPLETQIAALEDAGLSLEPGRTIDELLHSWPRSDYESDPYGLLLFMYGSEVEAEPWGRVFCARGWNFDMECLVQAGDYARALTEVVRITGQPQLVTDLSDDFDGNAKTAEIRYAIAGRPRRLKARVNNDWADPEAVAAFMRDIETTLADGRRYWAADNGQASILFFLTDAEAAKVNALRPEVLLRYTAA